ncbi:hypothetical protein FRC00_010015 [Tulasnella sp. 408]|nr:hypothetical protein FRC00_010015 [Tulasnella sp. 408]
MSSNGKLTDEAINIGGTILKLNCLELGYSAANRSLLLSCYEIERLRGGTSQEELWSHFERSLQQITHDPEHEAALESYPQDIDSYLWIIPIHRPHEEHWTLGVVDLKEKTIFHYDSLSSETESYNDVQLLLQYCNAITEIGVTLGLCDQYDFSGFSIIPGALHACQTNGYDCGLWVLAHIFAVLRGHTVTALKEDQMLWWRATLSEQVCVWTEAN